MVDDDDDDDEEDADNEVGFEADEFPRSSSMSCVSISIKSSWLLGFSTSSPLAPCLPPSPQHVHHLPCYKSH